MANVKVIRVLIMEGDKNWIDTTLSKCLVSSDVPFECTYGTITEVCRLRDTGIEPGTPVNPDNKINPFEVPHG